MTDNEQVRILVVDDDEAIRTMVAKILQRESFEVDTARDGQEAIEMLGENDYDAILLDLMMPRVDGFGVIEHLRSSNPAILKRVVVMTAFTAAARERIETTCKLVPKPFDVSQLVEVVRSCVGGSSADEALEAAE
jgi:two-component system, chemotaxis family, chemotaxis protein CheY